jgi:hypothetical protein
MKKLIGITVLFLLIQANVFSQTMNVTYKLITEKDISEGYSFSAEYPKVDFGPDALMGLRGIAGDINLSIDTLVKGKIFNFKNIVSVMPNKTAMNGMLSSMEITSSASVVSGTIFSAQIKEFTSVMGMAHPNTSVVSLNYSAVSGGLLESISVLFLTGSGYLKYVSDYCINDLRTKAKSQGYTNIDNMITEGASPDLKNFGVWNISEDNLIITFNPYTVAPYVFGIQTVSIPLANMTEMINRYGPLEFMFR